jgi:hypothetical protein
VRLLQALLGCLLAAGCASHWDGYDNSLYAVTMEPGPEAYQAHVDLLRDWAGEGEELPPGLAAELGFYLALTGHPDEARLWFDREVARFPEAAAFVEAMRAIALPPQAGEDAQAAPPEAKP